MMCYKNHTSNVNWHDIQIKIMKESFVCAEEVQATLSFVGI